MNWLNCFSGKRYGLGNELADIRSAYERDWDRIIFSSPFRRLQNKTQVFPLPGEVFVHNRLTHSLEVASVGRSLGKIIGSKLVELPEIKQDNEARKFYRNQLKNVVAAACLAHDLGNPAFGHSGEEAISKYFKKRETDNPIDLAFKSLFKPQEWSDLTNFEGNANALRILTKKSNGKLSGGYRLTYSTLGAILKYPCESSASLGKKGPLYRKKYGFFQIDEEVFLSVVQELNMIQEEVESRIVYKRHPFVYLVEAADDICYNIIDLEDSHRLGIISYLEVETILKEIIKANPMENVERFEENLEHLKKDQNEAVAYLRAKAINSLIYKSADVFMQEKDNILKGTYNSSLVEDITDLKHVLDKITEFSYKYIYNFEAVVKIEIAGFRIMSGLVEDFVEAALTIKEKRTKEQNKILELLPYQFKFDESSAPYNKVMHIIDFISGMTDLYALKLYRNLRGIEMPSI